MAFGHSVLLNPCLVAVFLLGLNIGLTLLLSLFLAGHSPLPDGAEPPRRQTGWAGHVHDDGFRRGPIAFVTSPDRVAAAEPAPCPGSGIIIMNASIVAPATPAMAATLRAAKLAAEAACHAHACKIYYVHVHKSGGEIMFCPSACACTPHVF